MDKKLINRLLIIVSVLLAVAGLIFMGITIFTKPDGNNYFYAALVCALLSNLFNVIRTQNKD